MAKSPFVIVLSDGERLELERRVACYTLPFKMVQRAKMVLELDLVGRRATLEESDVRWLYALAKTTGGSSLGSRDRATRLKSL